MAIEGAAQPESPSAPSARPGVAQRMAARAALRSQLVEGTIDESAPAPEAKPDAAPANDEQAADASKAGDDKPAVEAKPDEKVDPETAKRLAAVQKAEARSREKLNSERAEFEAQRKKLDEERAELSALRERVEKFEKLSAKAKIDPAAALEALGVEDFDYAARQAYARTKAQADDPKNREAAARAMREREAGDKLTATEKRIADLERKLEERDQRAQVQRQADEYMAGVTKAAGAAGDDTPLLRHFMAKNPEATVQRLRRVAFDLAQEMDDIPEHADVIARYEKLRRAELDELGVDPATILSPATAKTKKNEQEAEKKNAAPTLSNDLSAPRAPRARVSEREDRAEVRRMLESGKLD